MTSVALVLCVAVVVAVVLCLRIGVRRLRTLQQRHRESLRLLHHELDDRYDLVPALVAASAGAGVDRERIRPVVGARSLAIAVRDQRLGLAERAGAENALSATIHELIAGLDGVDHWPFLRIAHELQNREQRIAGAVRVHNDLVSTLNAAVGRFPTSLCAKLAAIGPVVLFEAPAPVTASATTETSEVAGSEVRPQPEAPSGTVAA
ncbi:LemA family protein [Rhodococcus sp. NPDC047139]|uniref:LemA family protein n=1 Tax=Rhodococcus sp. NPDC047139 TaxID=3155141 RepID=UPI00340F45E4